MINHENMNDKDHENGMMMSKNDSGMGHMDMMKVSILPFGFIFGSRGVSAFPEVD